MKLSDKFKREETEWRIQQQGVSNGKPWAVILPYITSRAIMDRLDEVIGVMNWKDEYEFIGENVLCKLSICVDGEWITKQDGAPMTKVEPFKGGISDAFKRTAVKFGMGRYLYALHGPYFAEFCEKKDGEYKSKVDGKYLWWKAPKDKEIYSD